MTVLKSIVYNPNYDISYPDVTFMNTIGSAAALNINAYKDSSNVTHNLTLGASSNVNIEALEGVNVYFDESNALTVFNTSVSNNVRQDREILNISSDQLSTYLTASNLKLVVSGQDSLQTTSISQTTFSTSNLAQLVDTPLGNGFIFATPMQLKANLDVADDVVSHNNIACSGNIFSSTLNLYKNVTEGSNTQVAYAFYINEYDQLDLVRYNKYDNENTISSSMKRIATFGKVENSNQTGDLNNYVAIDQFNGIVGQSNGVTTNFTSVLWGNSPNGSNIFYNNGYVGIGTMTPSEILHINQGNLRIGGAILPDADMTYSIGTQNLQFNDIHVGTVNVGGGSISTDPTSGSILLEGTDYVQVNLTSLVEQVNDTSNALFSSSFTPGSGGGSGGGGVNITSNITMSNYGQTLLFSSNNNLGINTSNPTEALHVNGNIRVAGCIYPDQTLTYDLGSEDLRFRDLFLSGNTINLGGAKITVDQSSGSISFGNANGQLVDTSGISGASTWASNAVIWASNAIANINVSALTSNLNLMWENNGNSVFVMSSNVGIGNNSPNSTLDVTGTINASTQLSTPQIVMGSTYLKNSGSNIGVGTNTPTSTLDVNGTLNVSSFITTPEVHLGSNVIAYTDSNISINSALVVGGSITSSSVNSTSLVSTPQLVLGGCVVVGSNNVIDLNSALNVQNNLIVSSNLTIQGDTTANAINTQVINNGTVINTTQLNTISLNASQITLGNNNASISADSNNDILINSSLNVEGSLNVSSDVSFSNINIGGELSANTLSTSNMIINNVSIFGTGSNIGFGTSNPEATVDIQGTFNVSDVSTFSSNVDIIGNLSTTSQINSGILQTDVLTTSQISMDSSFIIGSNNCIGFGNSNPTSTVDIAGTLNVSGDAVFNSSILINSVVVNEITLSNAVINANSSNIGINNNNPTFSLDVKGNFNVSEEAVFNTLSACNVDATIINVGSVAISSSNNNLEIAGALTVSDVTTFSSDVNILGNLSASNFAITSLSTCNILTPQLEIGNAIVYGFESNIGIGTQSAQSTLDIQGTLNVSDLANFESNVNIANLEVFNSLTTPQLTLGTTSIYNLNSNIGIGNSQPGSTLDITGTLNVTDVASFSSNVTIGGELIVQQINLSNVSCTEINTFDATVSNMLSTPQINIGNISLINSNNALEVSGSIHVIDNVVFESNLTIGGQLNVNAFNTPNVSTLQINMGNTGIYNVNSYIGIGKSNPGYNLDVEGDINVTGSLYNNGVPINVSQWTSDNTNSNIYVTGSNIGINTTLPMFPLDVCGEARISSNMSVGGDLTVFGTLSVSNVNFSTSNITIYNGEITQSNLLVIDTATLCNAVDIYGILTLSNSLQASNINVTGLFMTSNQATFNSNVTVLGSTSLLNVATSNVTSFTLSNTRGISTNTMVVTGSLSNTAGTIYSQTQSNIGSIYTSSLKTGSISTGSIISVTSSNTGCVYSSFLSNANGITTTSLTVKGGNLTSTTLSNQGTIYSVSLSNSGAISTSTLTSSGVITTPSLVVTGSFSNTTGTTYTNVLNNKGTVTTCNLTANYASCTSMSNTNLSTSNISILGAFSVATLSNIQNIYVSSITSSCNISSSNIVAKNITSSVLSNNGNLFSTTIVAGNTISAPTINSTNSTLTNSIITNLTVPGSINNISGSTYTGTLSNSGFIYTSNISVKGGVYSAISSNTNIYSSVLSNANGISTSSLIVAGSLSNTTGTIYSQTLSNRGNFYSSNIIAPLSTITNLNSTTFSNSTILYTSSLSNAGTMSTTSLVVNGSLSNVNGTTYTSTLSNSGSIYTPNLSIVSLNNASNINSINLNATQINVNSISSNTTTPLISPSSNIIVVSGNQYGNGTFVVSDNRNSTYAYTAFGPSQFYMGNNSNDYLSSGAYTGSTVTVVNGANYVGDWIQVQVPSSASNLGVTQTLFSYTLYARVSYQNRAPSQWMLAGSTDNVNWTVIDYQNGITWASGQTRTFNIPTVYINYYPYVRIICMSTAINSFDNLTLHFGLSLTHTYKTAAFTLSNSSGIAAMSSVGSNIGINNVSPLNALDVVGNIKASQSVIASSLAVSSVATFSNINFTGNFTKNGTTFNPGSSSCNTFINSGSTIYTVGSNVAIGKSVASYPLDVQGSASVSQTLYASNINFVGSLTQNGLPFVGSTWSNNGSKLFITGSNIGIGNINPAYQLDVTGTVNVTSTLMASNLTACNITVNSITATTYNNLLLNNGNSSSLSNAPTCQALSNVNALCATASNRAYTQWVPNGSSLYVISSNIGIGTSNPQSALHVTSNLRVDGSIYMANALQLNGIMLMPGGNNGTNVTSIVGSTNITSNIAFSNNTGSCSLYSFSNNIGFSRSNPTASVDILGSFKVSSTCQVGSNITLSNTSGNPYLSSLNSNIGIGVTNPNYSLHVAGTIFSGGYITSLSDRRFKENLEPLMNSLDKVCMMKGYSYTRTDYEEINEEKDTKHIGFIAQELEELMPELIHYDKVNDKYSVKYCNVIAVLAESIKELRNEVEELKKKK